MRSRLFALLLLVMCPFLNPFIGYAELTAQEQTHPEFSDKPQALYRLGPSDTISVRFVYNPEFNESVQIRPDGRISLGFVGDLFVSGFTIGELTEHLQSLYQSILRRPVLSIQVTNYASQKFFVGGEVQKPGMFVLAGSQTVLGAILEAGGMTKNAQRSEVYLTRRSRTAGATTITVSLVDMPDLPIPAATFHLEPYDVVVVAESRVSQANRFVDQYIRQMLPFLLSGGFTYLLNGDSGITPK